MIDNIPFFSLEQAITKAHLTKDVKFLLLPFFSFRMYVCYNSGERKKAHYYGNEHQVTYNQLLYQKVPVITLSVKKGYMDLLQMVEHTIKGRYTSAKLYMRAENKQFDILCREYYKGQLNENTVNDPVLSDDEGRVLYYNIIRGQVRVYEKDPSAMIEIDFKGEVSSHLK